MQTLSTSQWILWFAVFLAQAALAGRMIATGSARRWPSLFAFITILTIKDGIRLANGMTVRNPFVDFWVYWIASFVAEIVEVSMIVEVARAVGNASRIARQMTTNATLAVVATCLTISIGALARSSMPAWRQVCYLVEQLDAAVSIAWLVAFIIIASFAKTFAGWPRGTRGIVFGLSIELTANSYTVWLHAHLSADALWELKSALFLISLAVWAGSTGPRVNSPEMTENDIAKLKAGLRGLDSKPEQLLLKKADVQNGHSHYRHYSLRRSFWRHFSRRRSCIQEIEVAGCRDDREDRLRVG